MRVTNSKNKKNLLKNYILETVKECNEIENSGRPKNKTIAGTKSS